MKHPYLQPLTEHILVPVEGVLSHISPDGKGKLPPNPFGAPTRLNKVYI